jgi:hypothetical protein
LAVSSFVALSQDASIMVAITGLRRMPVDAWQVKEENRFVKPYQPKLGNALISSFWGIGFTGGILTAPVLGLRSG